MLSRQRMFRLLLLTFMCLIQRHAVRAQESASLVDAARALAGKIEAGLGAHDAITLTTTNQSSLSAAEIEIARRSLESELRSHNRKSSNPAGVHVIFSENLRGLLWIAEISRGGPREPAMVTMIETAPPTEAQQQNRPVRLVIDKKPIIEQDQPILDMTLPGAEKILSVLQPDGVVRYRAANDRWEPLDHVQFTGLKPFPRDIRGRIVTAERGGFRAWLPGAICDPICRQTDEAWPLDLPPNSHAVMAAGRNFFEDSAKTQPPFFSSAGVGGSLWLMAGVDGRTQLTDGTTAPRAIFSGWGSDLAPVDSPCGGKLALVAKARDWTQADSVQAYQVANGQAVAVSDAVEFAGPVTALWPSGAGSVVAISRDLKTAKYAGFSLAISCSP